MMLIREPRRASTSARSACGLDIGSNTFSCAELTRVREGLRVVDDVSLAVRLSEGLSPGGRLSAAAVARGLAALEQLKIRFDLACKPLRVVATQVLRMTARPLAFSEPASRLLGVEVEILDGEEEALLASQGAVHALSGEEPRIVVDVGGQSTELCWQTPSSSWQPLSLPLGVVGLSEKHLRCDPPLKGEIAALRAEVAGQLDAALPVDIAGQVVAIAGTATTLGLVHLGLVEWRRDQVHGLEMGTPELEQWLARMIAIDSATRQARYAVPAGRADVFPAGLAVLGEVLGYLARDRFVISAGGLRIGAALSLLEEE